MTSRSPTDRVSYMDQPKVLPLPGNSTREGNFYQEQSQQSGVPEWPGRPELGIDQTSNGAPTAPDPSPFQIIGG